MVFLSLSKQHPDYCCGVPRYNASQNGSFYGRFGTTHLFYVQGSGIPLTLGEGADNFPKVGDKLLF